MAGRFPLFTDENVPGPIIQALRERGWDLVHAVEIFGERTDDPVLFQYAVSQGRVLVTTDDDHLADAHEWLEQGRAFRMIYWHQRLHQRRPAGPFVVAFEDLAAEDEPFAFPLCFLQVHF